MLGHIGIVIFVFQRNSVILNLKANSKNQRKYPKILFVAVSIIFVWYMLIGLVAYFTFRSQTKDYITSNLEPLDGFAITTNLMFCLNALTSYPIQILCCFELVEKMAFFNNKEESNCK